MFFGFSPPQGCSAPTASSAGGSPLPPPHRGLWSKPLCWALPPRRSRWGRPWLVGLSFFLRRKKNKIQNESDETSLSRLISKARPCKELRCASGTSGITRSGRQHGQGRPRSAASLPLPTGQRDGGKEIRFCCRCRAGILELRPERVPGTRWHPLGLARGGETGGV